MSRRLPLPDPTVVIAAPGPTPSRFTPGTVPYADADGRLTESATLFWDPVAGTLTTGSTSIEPTRISVDGSIILNNDGSGFLSNGNLEFTLGGKLSKYSILPTEGWGMPSILDDVALTAQNASIASSNFANAGNVGTYRVGFYLLCTTADLTAGSISLSVTFNDGVGARTLTSIGVALTSTANKTTKFTNTDIDGSLIKLGSGSIAYSTTLVGIAGTAQYALYITLERLS